MEIKLLKFEKLSTRKNLLFEDTAKTCILKVLVILVILTQKYTHDDKFKISGS